MEARATKHKQRAYEIVLRLSQYGPLSTVVLNKMLAPRMKPKKLRQALYRLRNKKILDTRIMGAPSHRAVYWQVSKEFLNEPTSKEIFGYDRDNLLRIRTSRRCLPSHGERQYWIYVLSHVLPNAEVVRRDQIAGHAEARRVLRLNDEQDRRLPDCLIFFSDVNDERLCIALDYEEFRWSADASLARLKSYARHTDLDGAIFITPTDYLQETASLLKRAIKHDPRLRKQGYSNTFFTFSDAYDYLSNPLSQLLDCSGQPTSFEDWYIQISAYKQAKLNSTEAK